MKIVPLKAELFERAKALNIGCIQLFLDVDADECFSLRVVINPINKDNEALAKDVWFWACEAYKKYPKHADYVDAREFGHTICYNITKGTMTEQGWQIVESYDPIRESMLAVD